MAVFQKSAPSLNEARFHERKLRKKALLLVSPVQPNPILLNPRVRNGLVLALAVIALVCAFCVPDFRLVAEALRGSARNATAFNALYRLSAILAFVAFASLVCVLFFLTRMAKHSHKSGLVEGARRNAQLHAEETIRELMSAEENFRVLFDQSSEAFFLVDQARVVECNQSAVLLLRALHKAQIIDRSLTEFAHESPPGGESSFALLERCHDAICGKGGQSFNGVYARLDGAELHVNVSVTGILLRGKTLTLVAWRDLTEKKEADDALLLSAARLRVAQAIAHLGHWEYDARTDRVLWSEEALRIFGFAAQSESPTLQSCFLRIHPEDRPAAEVAFASAIRRGKPTELYFRILLPDGNIRHVDSRSRSDLNVSGKAGRVSGTILDITEQKQVEARLRQTLAEKELLVREVHHRVKNNLQVISSLLSMQIDLLEDPDSVHTLRESQHRISSIALIHERLYSHGNIDNVDFGEYTETLVQELFHAYGKQAQHIYKCLDLAPVPLNIEKAIPCGLILNELVTNALKHAFPSGRGTLNIRLKSNSKNRLSLCVSDSGIGLPEHLNLRDSKSLGLPLVEVLARQLGGVLHVQSKPGATFTVEFPVSGVI